MSKNIAEVVSRDKYCYPKLKPVEYLEASAGFGKTYSCIKHVVETEIPNDNAQWVYLGKSTALCDESLSLALKFNDKLIYEIISSYDDVKESVHSRVVDALEGKKFDILFITHSAFLYMIKESKGYMFNDCNILLDENIDILSLYSISVNRQEDCLAKVLKPLDDNKYLPHRYKAYVERTLKSDKASTKYKDFLRMLSSDRLCFMYEKEDEYEYCTYYLHDIRQVLLTCKRFISLGAKLKDTLNTGLYSSLGIKVIPYTDVPLKRDCYLNQERISIYYMVNEVSRETGCTSSVLDGLWDYKNGNFVSVDTWKKSPFGMESYPHHHSVFDECLIRSREVLGDEFIFTLNKKRDSGDIFPDGVGERIPYGCYGVNHLKHYSNAMALFTFKPNTARSNLLTELGVIFNFPEINQKYLEYKEYEAQYQTITRGVCRDFSLPNEPIIWVVSDLNVASYIKEHHVQGAIIKDTISIKLPKGTVRNGGHNKADFKIRYDVTKSEGTRINDFNSKFRKKNMRDPLEQEALEYLTKYRDKQKRKLNR